MTRHGLFVTGTDTGVGKSAVTAALARALHRRGVDVGVMKPVETGVAADPAGFAASDAGLLARAAEVADAPELVGPVRLREPLAPSVAAELEGREVRLEEVLAAYRTLAARHACMLVEGAGGLAVPVAPGVLISDLVRATGLRLLIVARPGLGTINHTVLTAHFARAVGLQLAGVVINGMPAEPGLPERTSPAVIEALAAAPVLAVLPWVEDQTVLVQRVGESRLVEVASQGIA